MRSEPRYIVTELEGWPIRAGQSSDEQFGLSTHVIDTAWNHRLIATYRVEDHRYIKGVYGVPSRARKRDYVRQLAREHAARLNG